MRIRSKKLFFKEGAHLKRLVSLRDAQVAGLSPSLQEPREAKFHSNSAAC